MEILRFLAAGNVDDGKSTLIGRLLYDSNSLQTDLVENIEKASQKLGTEFNLALLTDGLKAEREQGITIDVAYKYFATAKRKFIIADCPGHVQYTRNMVTGASTADLMILLVDARKGITEQTRRHSAVGSLLGIEHFAVCINKMDLVDYSQSVYDSIREDYQRMAMDLNLRDLKFIPVSASLGENVVHRSVKMPYYDGPSLLEYLETVMPEKDQSQLPFRFPVQNVLLPRDGKMDRYFAGQICAGTIRRGDTVELFPGGKTKIKSIRLMDADLAEATAPQSVSLQIEDEIDVARGCLIASGAEPDAADEWTATVCWMDARALKPGAKYTLRHTTNTLKCQVMSIDYRVDMGTLGKIVTEELAMNDIGRIRIKLARAIRFDPYLANRWTGSFILIDEANQTAGAGVIEG
ncbi:MAG TPA: GTP-binding protein [Leptospiraceae bacterium]|nr:50S ribosome-binding GTPase [Leptospirales bacterium]HMU83692.1 GTP-binding protein [Leptospiraceae bacterium]HMW59487.1 GTP-binding protein [Leptospiraceae bacterium]HMX57028.1 GTP-binding protein [Leptospiraceae bacterium]HMY44189.1 GTP-binding protein [Leptospiraceae bacterium]